MRKEIGGYFELERFSGVLPHEGALALSSGRACLAYLIEQRQIRKMLLPDFICDVVEQVCESHRVALRRYAIREDLRPPELQPEDGEWVYLVNYYGQLTQEELRGYAAKYPRVIIDNAQAFFAPAIPGVDTLYTCRKFFGVSDGGFLYTDAPERALERDESWARMRFVLGRYERPAGEFFAEASQNNDLLPEEPKQMSALTENLLRAVDYDAVRKRRTENYQILNEVLGSFNCQSVRHTEGAYAYPLMLEEGERIRKELIARKIFVAQLWPNVLRSCPEESPACRLTRQILPLPCDQRYGQEEMQLIIDAVRTSLL
ncbi:MAG: hypothetical protein IJQ02_09750 [Oscillospiraceae bacterium]|nr:hypothetical protein [Oscillospiraceae bacterium]